MSTHSPDSTLTAGEPEMLPAHGGSHIHVAELAVIGAGAVVVLAAMIWLVGVQGVADTPQNAGSSLSAGRRGTLALYRWLERSGFEVQRVAAGQRFPPDVDTLFMVNPNDNFPQGQAQTVRRWVEEGHTLVLALGPLSDAAANPLGGGYPVHPMLRELGVGIALSAGYTVTVPVAQPVFNRPAISRVRMPGVLSLELPGRDALVLVSSTDGAGRSVQLAGMLKTGKGRVFVLASDYPLSNEGLREEDNGGLVYNIVQMAGGRRVAFDEAHHGADVGGDIVALLAGNPWGWALIYAVLLAGAYTIWSARRLGPPLPVSAPDRRRPTSDYVRSVAGLFRRARKPGYVAERYLQFFRRTLSHYAGLDPYLTDERFVQALAERGRHPFDQAEMLTAMRRLRELAGDGPGNEAAELATLRAIREAERVRRQALGLQAMPHPNSPAPR